MTPVLAGSDPLAPVRAALLERARADADAVLSDADAAAVAVRTQAQEEAEAVLSAARALGCADAAAVLAGERARAARTSRGIVLAAQRAAYDQLRRRARDAVSDLRNDPGYPAVLAALRDRVVRDLGPDAVVTEDERGGVVGECAGRTVRYTLDDLADAVVERLGSDLGGLWSP